MIEQTAQALADEKAVGWFQGRMEFGPRALGARSILGDARSPVDAEDAESQGQVPRSRSGRSRRRCCARTSASGSSSTSDSPYMLLVADVHEERRRAMTRGEQALFGIDKLNVPRSDIPAVTHVDYSARIQTVHKETNPRFHALISALQGQDRLPGAGQHQFNVRGEPIVCTPEDAFRCFMGTEIEVLAVGNCFLKKEDQDPALKLDYKNAFELD